MRIVERSALCDRFAVSDLRLTDDDFALVFALHAFDIDGEVQFAHTFDDRFVRFGIDVGLESRIFFRKAVERFCHLSGVFFFFRRDRFGDDGIRNVHRRHGIIESAAAERITGCAVDAEERYDIARCRFVDVFHLVRIHADEPPDFELFARARIVQFASFRDSALIHADVGELTVLSVVEFECDRDGRLVRDIEELDLRFVIVEVESIIVNLGRVGKIACNAVEYELHAFVHVSRTAEHADELLRERRFTDGRDDLFFGFFAFEGVFHELIVEHRYRIDQIRAIFFCLIDHVRGNFCDAHFLTVGTFEIERLHCNKVDDAFEFVFKPDRERHHVGVESEFIAQLFTYADGISALTVAFIDECNAGYMIALQLAIDGDRLGLNACDRTQNEDGAVEDA